MATIESTIVGRHFIAGQWRDGGGATFENRNPAHTAEVLGTYPRGGHAEVDAAVHAARDAFPEWRRMSRIARGEMFLTLTERIRAEVDSLARILARESGKVLNEARAEVVEGLHMVEYVFGTARQPTGSIVESEIAAKDLSIRRKPRGVVAVITPWNFPFAVPLWMLGPSLMEGNTVVFKPSEETPGIGERLIELFVDAGFPAGTVNLVHGIGEEAGESLASHDDVDVVCFTGSYAVGSHIRRLAAESDHKTCALEMGSKSAVIVCDDAGLDLACDAAILSAFKTTGQRCVSAGRILVHEKLFDRFAEGFCDRARRLKFSDPFDPAAFAGPLINAAAVEKVARYNQLAIDEGAEVLLGGDRMTDAEHGGRQLHGAVRIPPNVSPRRAERSAKKFSDRMSP